MLQLKLEYICGLTPRKLKKKKKKKESLDEI